MLRGSGRILIVGNGIAGITAADTLRSAGFDGELTIAGAEMRPAYSRPALSKTLLRSGVGAATHELPASQHGASELLGVAATSLDPERRVLSLSDGSEIGYDGLVIASGSRPRRLGLAPDEFVLRTLEDAVALRTLIAARPEVVIVGAGPLGMEVASGALELGCRVTMVASRAPMIRHLGALLSATITAAARVRGLNLVVADDPRIIEQDGRSVVLLPGGRIIRGDLLITAVGDIPNTEWLTGSGLRTGAALTVDSRGRLRPEIVAAGDVAAIPTATGHARSPIWFSAIEQARVAAVALLHGDAAPELHAQPYFWTELFGLTIRVAGRMPLTGEPEFVDGDDPAGPALIRWRHADGCATAVAVNYRIPIPRLRQLCAAVS